MKALVFPGALVMTQSGVKDPALALVAHPGVRLVAAAPLFAHHEDPEIVAQLVVDIGFVPTFEAFDGLHGGVQGVDDAGTKDAGLMLEEPAANERRVASAVAEAV